MNLDERVEAAWLAASVMRQSPYPPKEWDEELARDFIKHLLDAAFPELFTDPPTHRLVPLKTVTFGTRFPVEDNATEVSASPAHLNRRDGE